MKKIITYMSDDGKTFDDELECAKHERDQAMRNNAELCVEMARIDDLIAKKYMPNSDDEVPVSNSLLWLIADIENIILKDRQAKDGIIDIINSSPLAEQIKSLLDENKITENIKIRSDFLSAFEHYDYVEIAKKIEYSFSEQDISNLAFIYKSGEHKEDIENLLQYCNFHKECGDFIKGKCEEYFLGEPPKTEKNKIKPNERY